MAYLLAKGLFIIVPVIAVDAVKVVDDMRPLMRIECTKKKKVHIKYTIPEA